MKDFNQLSAEVGELVTAKAEAYGHSFAKCSLHLRLLYPEGIRPDQYADAMLLARLFDKSMRIANQPAAFGESPWNDLAGYALLGVYLHQQLKEESEPCGNASGPVAESQSEVKTRASADQPVSEQISPSASAKTVSEPLPQPDGCSQPLASAPVSTATASAIPSAADPRSLFSKSQRISWIGHTRELWLSRENCGFCVACVEQCSRAMAVAFHNLPALRVCSKDCFDFCVRRVMESGVEGVR